MNLITRTPRIELLLRRNQLLNLENSQPHMAIECKDGVLWVTVSGDNRDHMIFAGQRFNPVKGTKVIVQALKDSNLDIEEN